MKFNRWVSRTGAMSVTGLVTGLGIWGPVAAQTAAADSGATQLEEVVVTGSRLQASGFNAPTPVTVVTSETIEQRAPANISEVLLEQPAFRIANTDSARPGSGGSNSNPLSQGLIATPDLRSLGSTRTLVLINGHRSVLTSWGGAVDINIVPVGLVERVDVVTGGASAAYGSDAIAGVVNVMLRNKMQGIKVGAQMGLTEHGAAKQYTFNLSGGTSLMNDRLHVLGGVDTNKTYAITDVYGTKFGQDEIGSYTPTAAQRTAGGLPATVITTNVEPASYAPGGLYAPSATGQAYTFDSSGNPVPFSRGAVNSNGQFMIGSTSNYGRNLNNLAPLRLPQSRYDVMGRASFDVTDNFDVYVEFGNSRNLVYPYKAGDLAQGAGVGTNNPVISVSPTNPFVTAQTKLLLPSQTANFTIGRNDTELSFEGISGIAARQDSETRRTVIGFEGKFGEGWKWDAYYQGGRTWTYIARDDLSYVAMQKAVNGCVATLGSPGFATQNLVTLAARYDALSGKTCVPFNPFGVGRNSQVAVDYVQNYTHQIQHLWLDVAAASVSGTPFKVPAGDVAVAAGAEWRQEALSAVSDPVSKFGNAIEGSMLTNSLVESIGENSVREAFAEMGVPLLKDKPGARSLDLNAALRATRYELGGNVRTWKVGLTWDPLDSVRMRLTRSHDIRVANLMSIFFVGGPNSNNVNTLLLPVGKVGANGTVYAPPAGTASATLAVPVAGGVGNKDLRPEIADTVTGGIVFTKGGFNVSGDYYYINMHDTIAGLPAQNVIDNCTAGDNSACGFITFNSGIPGGIQLIQGPNTNLNRTVVKGLDFEVGYRIRLGPGNFQVRALANYQPHNEAVNNLTGQTTDSANTLGSQPKLAYNLSLGYDVGRWTADLQIRGFGGRRGNNIVYNADGSVASSTILGPEDGAAWDARVNGNVATSNNTINKNRYPGQYFVNPAVTFKVNDKVTAFLNVDNLFDKQPPELATAYTVYDYVGRRYRAGVRANF